MSTATTKTSSPGWSPDVQAFAPEDVIPEALIMQASTISGRIEGDAPVVRVVYVEDADADFVDEGADIDESDPELAEVEVATKKVAQLVKISREQYVQTGTAGLLSASVKRAVIRKANAAFVAQVAPTPPAVAPPPGLINIPDVLADFAPITTNFDPITDAVAAIEQNEGTASLLLASPLTWAALRKIKTASGSEVPILTQSGDVLEVPRLKSTAVPLGKLLVVDKGAVPSAVGDVLVATSDQVYFKSDSIAVRVTFRLGWNAVRPDRIAVLDVSGVAADDESSSSSSSGA